MHIPASLVPAWAVIVSMLLVVAAFSLAAWRAPWAAVRQEPTRMHLIAGGAVACLLLWLLNVKIVDSVLLHFLGVTTLTLLVGWCFAVLAGTLALVGFYLLQTLGWAAFPTSVCLTILLPATISQLFLMALYRLNLQHPFVYILGAGFAGGALVVFSLSLAALLFFWSSGLTSLFGLALEWWPLVFLLMFSEGFLNGMCVSALAVFYPDWMKTFDDRFYLDDR